MTIRQGFLSQRYIAENRDLIYIAPSGVQKEVPYRLPDKLTIAAETRKHVRLVSIPQHISAQTSQPQTVRMHTIILICI